MFDGTELKITKEQAEEHIIGKKRTAFIADLGKLDKLLLNWASGAENDKAFTMLMCRCIDSIKRSVVIYK